MQLSMHKHKSKFGNVLSTETEGNRTVMHGTTMKKLQVTATALASKVQQVYLPYRARLGYSSMLNNLLITLARSS